MSTMYAAQLVLDNEYQHQSRYIEIVLIFVTRDINDEISCRPWKINEKTQS